MVANTITLPTILSVVELGEYNAPRSCSVCGSDADFYVYVTADEVGDGDVEEWPVNAMLCRKDFIEADRVTSVEELL